MYTPCHRVTCMNARARAQTSSHASLDGVNYLLIEDIAKISLFEKKEISLKAVLCEASVIFVSFRVRGNR